MQCCVARPLTLCMHRYHRNLMMAILHDRIQIASACNVQASAADKKKKNKIK